MKFEKYNVDWKTIQSPPSRGAWIEISFSQNRQKKEQVAPLAGGVD